MEAVVTLDRSGQLARGRRLNRFTLAYNALEGVVALAAGVAAGSVALVGFGFDSGIELAAGVAALLRLAADTIIAYSDKPLRLAVRFGFAMSFLAFLYGLTILYRGLVHDIPVTGWASLIVSLYFIGGVIIAILGIIGIYVGKTFDEVKRRPLYIVSKTTFTQKDDPAA